MINSNASVSNVRFERRAEVGHCSASLIDGEQKMGCQYHLIRIHSNEIEDSTMGPYRTFLITGATRGIGRALSDKLSEQGHLVVGIARNSDASFPGVLYTTDLSSSDETNLILMKIAKNHEVHGIVNNVGVALPQQLGSIDIPTFLNVMDIKMALNKAGVELMTAASPHHASRTRITSLSRMENIAAKPRLMPLVMLVLITNMVSGPGTRTISVAPSRYVQKFTTPKSANIFTPVLSFSTRLF